MTAAEYTTPEGCAFTEENALVTPPGGGYVVILFTGSECEEYAGASCVMAVKGPYPSRESARAVAARQPDWTCPHITGLSRLSTARKKECHANLPGPVPGMRQPVPAAAESPDSGSQVQQLRKRVVT